MHVKILRDGVKKFKTLTEVQRQLHDRGVRISLVALNNALHGRTRTLRSDVFVALVDLVYDGDWSKAGKGLREDIKE